MSGPVSTNAQDVSRVLTHHAWGSRAQVWGKVAGVLGLPTQM